MKKRLAKGLVLLLIVIALVKTTALVPLAAEETEWFYRSNNGVVEKSMWSYTYGKWLTDWMPATRANNILVLPRNKNTLHI